jgi:putative transposase
VHMLISIPPKYSVAEVIGYLKGKSSSWIAQAPAVLPDFG